MLLARYRSSGVRATSLTLDSWSRPALSSFANLTNVYEHAPDVAQTLLELPLAEDAPVVWSNRAGVDRRMRSEVAPSPRAYLESAKRAQVQWSAAQRRAMPSIASRLQHRLYGKSTASPHRFLSVAGVRRDRTIRLQTKDGRAVIVPMRSAKAVGGR